MKTPKTFNDFDIYNFTFKIINKNSDKNHYRLYLHQAIHKSLPQKQT